MQAISVDDKTNRVILVSAEASPRAAALMQFDIQQTMPSTNVLVARPLVVDLGQIARTLFPTAEAAQIDLSVLQKQKGRKKKTRAGPICRTDESHFGTCKPHV
ncbi:MAG TPA: hypothetical protein VHR44_05885 [Beijerinckiaceae bacterium]|nr:hypothetical protein [Beijerinckiaceae bacterium]